MVYHATGHKLQCQLEYHPEKISGFGMTDGEGTERLNWKLQPFFTSLKEVGIFKKGNLFLCKSEFTKQLNINY
jgi:hypothetical protein